MTSFASFKSFKDINYYVSETAGYYEKDYTEKKET